MFKGCAVISLSVRNHYSFSCSAVSVANLITRRASIFQFECDDGNRGPQVEAALDVLLVESGQERLRGFVT